MYLTLCLLAASPGVIFLLFRLVLGAQSWDLGEVVGIIRELSTGTRIQLLAMALTVILLACHPILDPLIFIFIALGFLLLYFFGQYLDRLKRHPHLEEYGPDDLFS